MLSCSRNDVVLARYPFSDFTGLKVRPAVVVSGPYPSLDVILVPLTSKTGGLSQGEFVLSGWQEAGLHVPTALMRGVYCVSRVVLLKAVGKLSAHDVQQLDISLRQWLQLDQAPSP